MKTKLRFRNSTEWGDAFIRRMLRWVMKELGCRSTDLRQAQFTKCRWPCRGRAWWSGRILVRVGESHHFPTAAWSYKGNSVPAHHDAIEALVSTTAHEVAHIVQYGYARSTTGIRALVGKRLEPVTCATEHAVTVAFREQRERLLAEWGDSGKVVATTPADAATEKQQRNEKLVERRAATVAKQLLNWQRKLKLAKTKIRKLKARNKYYEKKAAAKQCSTNNKAQTSVPATPAGLSSVANS